MSEAIAEMADAGVAESDNSGDAGTPPVQENEYQAEPTQEPEESGEVLPFGKHPRWQKMNQANRELRERTQSYESQLKQLEGAAALEKVVRSNPAYAKVLHSILSGADPQALLKEFANQGKDPYADYEPDVAERFRKLDAFEEWKQQQEASKVTETQATIDREFDSLLQKDGYVGSDGKPVDENFVDLISLGVNAWLMNNASNAKAPSMDEFHYAYKAVKDGLDHLQKIIEKQTLKKTVRTDVPASGSRQGAPPSGKAGLTDKDRIMDIANSL